MLTSNKATMLATAFLSLFVAFVDGFQSIHPQSYLVVSSPHGSKIAYPLYYSNGADDPETRSIVTPPPIIFHNGKSIVVKRSPPLSVVKRNTKDDADSSASELSIEFKPKRKSAVKVNTKKSTKTPTTQSQVVRKGHQDIWSQRYSELLAFHSEYGHTLIPQAYTSNPKLGLWVMAQRRQYTLKTKGKSNSLSQERIELLDKVGFVWKVEKRGPRGAYGEIRKLKKNENGEYDPFYYSNSELERVANFENYIIEKRMEEEWSEDQMMNAWKQRFQIFEKTIC